MPAEPVAAAPRSPMTPVPHRVDWRRRDTLDTVTIGISPVAEALPAPRPGQFEMLWAFGVGEVPISVSGIGNGDGKLEHTIRSVGAVTAALGAAQVGDVIGARGPYGVGWDLDLATGRDLLIVAGGLGVAPVRPVVIDALAHRHRYNRMVLLIGAREPGSLLYPDELEQWRGRFDMDVEVTVDAAPPSWRGDVGVVTKLIDRAPIDPPNTTAVVCGPEMMMRFVGQGLVDHGVPGHEIWLSMERNMRCAIGHCGHCQLGPEFICKDGPVLAWTRLEKLMMVRER